jgi:Domain of Unknown Function (DUF748)
MKAGQDSGVLPGNQPEAPRPARRTRRRRGRWWAGIILLFLLIAVGILRIFLPQLVRDYVNRTLDRNLLYEGRIGEAEIHLWRGAYSIDDVHLSQRTGDVPVPLLSVKRVDFSIQWGALLHGRVVGQFTLQEPELNFVAASNVNESQTGSGGPWLQTIQDLFPFSINKATVQNGSIHFRTYKSQKPVDVYLAQFNGTIDNLSNIRDELNPLVATVQATALAMDQARLQLKMTLNPSSYRPSFHLAVQLLGLDVTRLNDLALTYGAFDFKRGWFDLVLEADSKEGQVTGYVKPLFRDLKVFSLTQDLKEDTVLQFFWQALVGGITTGLKNVPRNQFGTLIPFTGDATGTTTTDIMSTIGNLLRNAFVRAYLPQLESEWATEPDFHFDAPEFTESLSTTSSEAQ